LIFWGINALGEWSGGRAPRVGTGLSALLESRPLTLFEDRPHGAGAEFRGEPAHGQRLDAVGADQPDRSATMVSRRAAGLPGCRPRLPT
jgi:hypothetical protein